MEPHDVPSQLEALALRAATEPRARRARAGLLATLAGAGVAAAVAALLAATAPGLAADAAHPRHLIYLHGRIVQSRQSSRPQHPQFGFYELERIRSTLQAQGFAVSAEIRPRSATVSESADRVVEQVRGLLDSGVPARQITVVGASMGGAIALLASTRLQEPELRFCVLGGCLHESVRHLQAEQGRGPSGHVLSIREASDDLVGPCPAWNEEAGSSSSLRAREIVLQTGLSHGFLYRPLPEWVDPVVEWASGR